MFAVIDCGTTNTRIFILSDDGATLAQGSRKIGVRDTSITGSRAALKNGVEGLYRDILRDNGLDAAQMRFAIASGMITSEIGLIEIPHLVAPAGLKELSEHIEKVCDPDVVDLGVPVYFIRGVRNNYGDDATIHRLRQVDFLRGEEVQCIGILEELKPKLPVNIVVLSSHTKIIHIDAKGRIAACMTTLSGQLFEALKASTNVGKSITDCDGEVSGGYTFEEIADVAAECVENAGFGRTMLMPRFMQVLLKTDSAERSLFVDAAIAMDDMKALKEFEAQGFGTDEYILFGHEIRQRLYEYMLHKYVNAAPSVTHISDPERISELTIKGAVITARRILEQAPEA